MKAGRNDPCPCGSGKKFKKCCIDKRDESAPGSSPSREPRAPTAERKDWAELARAVGNGSLDERIGRLTAAFASGAGLDGEAVFELTAPLVDDLHEAGRASDIGALLDRIREFRPAAYDEKASWFDLWRAESAVLANAPDLEQSLAAFAPRAAQLPDGTARLVDRLLWHGKGDPLLRMLEAMWPAYRDSEDIADWAKHDMAALAGTILVDRHLQGGGPLDAPGLLASIGRFATDGGPTPDELVARVAPHPSRRWSVEDLSGDRSAEAYGALLSTFRARLTTAEGWPMTRAALAEREVGEALSRGWRTDERRLGPVKPLPQADALARWASHYVAGLPAMSAGYACAAYLAALPAWAGMLGEMGVVDAVAGKRVARSALKLSSRLLDDVAFLTSDPGLRRELEQVFVASAPDAAS